MISAAWDRFVAIWDRVLDACDVDRHICEYPNATHEPLDSEETP